MLCLFCSYCWLEVSLRGVSLSIPTHSLCVPSWPQSPWCWDYKTQPLQPHKILLKIVLKKHMFFFQLSEEWCCNPNTGQRVVTGHTVAFLLPRVSFFFTSWKVLVFLQVILKNNLSYRLWVPSCAVEPPRTHSSYVQSLPFTFSTSGETAPPLCESLRYCLLVQLSGSLSSSWSSLQMENRLLVGINRSALLESL